MSIDTIRDLAISIAAFWWILVCWKALAALHEYISESKHRREMYDKIDSRWKKVLKENPLEGPHYYPVEKLTKQDIDDEARRQKWGPSAMDRHTEELKEELRKEEMRG